MDYDDVFRTYISAVYSRNKLEASWTPIFECLRCYPITFGRGTHPQLSKIDKHQGEFWTKNTKPRERKIEESWRNNRKREHGPEDMFHQSVV